MHRVQRPLPFARPVIRSSRASAASLVAFLFGVSWLALVAAGLLISPAALADDDTATVEGIVVNEAKEPVKDALVVVTSPELEGFEERTTTDSKGRFRIVIEDPERAYLWKFTAEGLDPNILTLEMEAGETRGYTVTLTAPTGEASRNRRAIELYNQGADAFNGGDAEAAISLLQEAYSLAPDRPEIGLALARVSAAAENLDLAAEVAEGLLKAGLDGTDDVSEEQATLNATVRATAARIVAEIGLVQENRDRFLAGIEAMEAGGDTADAAIMVFNAGATAARAGEEERALSFFQWAADLDPSLMQAQVAAAERLIANGFGAQALPYARRQLEAKPDDPRSHRLVYLALEIMTTEDATKASERDAAFDAYAVVAPESAVSDALIGAEELFKRGENKQAQTLLDRLVVLDPNSARAHYLLGLVLLNQGSIELAKGHLQRVVELEPSTSDGADAQEMLNSL